MNSLFFNCIVSIENMVAAVCLLGCCYVCEKYCYVFSLKSILLTVGGGGSL
jgi:hypothetical protein